MTSSSITVRKCRSSGCLADALHPDAHRLGTQKTYPALGVGPPANCRMRSVGCWSAARAIRTGPRCRGPRPALPGTGVVVRGSASSAQIAPFHPPLWFIGRPPGGLYYFTWPHPKCECAPAGNNHFHRPGDRNLRVALFWSSRLKLRPAFGLRRSCSGFMMLSCSCAWSPPPLPPQPCSPPSTRMCGKSPNPGNHLMPNRLEPSASLLMTNQIASTLELGRPSRKLLKCAAPNFSLTGALNAPRFP